mgnify:CR=1 FL=1
MTTVTQPPWEQSCREELTLLRPILAQQGYVLDDKQVHLGGERSVISNRKMVLLGKHIPDQRRVVIKTSRNSDGQGELKREKACREVLNHMRFARDVFLSPELLLWQEKDGFVIAITAFLDQTVSFLERPFREQFFLAMKAFETQEGAHATTFEHGRMIRGIFQVFDPETYVRNFAHFQQTIREDLPEESTIHHHMERAQQRLMKERLRLKQYAGFLTHGDFVPHNIRVVGHDIYLLDHSDMRFGNKYDGWARFLNFMLLYHRELETACVQYVKDNRAPEEREALELMRLYRLGELISYYAQRCQKSSENLQRLDRLRVSFWGDVLGALLQQEPLSEARIETYRKQRDVWRSPEEHERQKGLH